MKKKNKGRFSLFNDKFLLLKCIFLAIGLALFTAYYLFQNGILAEPVSLSINGLTSAEAARLQVNRYSLSGSLKPLSRDDSTKPRWSEQANWFRQIQLVFPNNETINKITALKVELGAREFVFTGRELREQWLKSVSGQVLSLESPQQLYSFRISLPYLAKLINLKNPFKYLNPGFYFKHFKQVFPAGALFVLGYYICWCLALLGLGSLGARLILGKISLANILPKPLIPTIYGLFGLMFVACLGNLSNYFIPLNSVFALSLGILGLIFLYIDREKIFSEIQKPDMFILFFLAVLIGLLIFVKLKNYDTGLYHLQSIKWLIESKLPLGLANLQGRFGFNSAWFSVSAVLMPPAFLVKTPYFLANAVLYFYLFSGVLFLLKEKVFKSEKYSFSELFLVFSIVPCTIASIQNDISAVSPSPNLAIALILTFITYLLIRSFEKGQADMDGLILCFMLAVFALTVKISGLPYVGWFGLLLFGYWTQHKQLLKHYLAAVTFSGLMLLLWLGRGLLTSGCLFYPLSIGWFPILKWAIPLRVMQSELLWIKSGSRNPVFDPLYDPHQVISNWQWLGPWAERVFSFGPMCLLGVMLILGLLFQGFSYFWQGHKQKFELKYWIPLIGSLLGIIYWFISAPAPTYGYGYIFSFALIIFSYGLFQLKFKYKEMIINDLGIAAVIFSMLLIQLYTLPNIEKQHIPEARVVVKMTNEGVPIYVPVSGDQTWDAPLPATPYFYPELKIKLGKQYPTMFWFYPRN